MKIFSFVLAALLLATLGCAQTPTPTLAPPSPSPAAMTESTGLLWYLLRGGPKADQAWSVDLDSAGYIYLAAYEQETGQFFTDMVIYKFTPEGEQVWRSPWGGQFQEKAFIVDVDEPYVYVGGLTQDSIDLTQADMTVLALDAATGKILWEFVWGQGFGYEEVDGLVAEGDYIFVSGWTTSEKTGGDIGVLKLDRQGGKVWDSVWGTDGFDGADGQMVVSEDSIYVSGRTNGVNMLLGGQAAVVRFSKDTGEYLQHATWGDSAMADGLGMTSDGTSLYVVGINLTLGRGNQIILLKYDQDLNLLWDEVWGDEEGEHVGRAAAVDDQGNVLLAVNSRPTSTGPDDVVLLKYGPDGNLAWESRWPMPDDEVVHGLAVVGDFAYLAGEIKYLDQNDSQALLIKADSRTGQFPPP